MKKNLYMAENLCMKFIIYLITSDYNLFLGVDLYYNLFLGVSDGLVFVNFFHKPKNTNAYSSNLKNTTDTLLCTNSRKISGNQNRIILNYVLLLKNSFYLYVISS